MAFGERGSVVIAKEQRSYGRFVKGASGMSASCYLAGEVETANIRCNDSRPDITVSIGVASVPTHGIVAQKVTLAADKAFIRRKMPAATG